MLLDSYSSISNRKDQHHIFPNNLLRRNSINPKWINSIANICYLESDENQSISSKHPSKYLIDYNREKHFGRVMKSHLIPYSKDSGVWIAKVKSAYPIFLNQRGKMILAEMERLAGAKMFTGFTGIKL